MSYVGWLVAECLKHLTANRWFKFHHVMLCHSVQECRHNTVVHIKHISIIYCPLWLTVYSVTLDLEDKPWPIIVNTWVGEARLVGSLASHKFLTGTISEVLVYLIVLSYGTPLIAAKMLGVLQIKCSQYVMFILICTAQFVHCVSLSYVLWAI